MEQHAGPDEPQKAAAEPICFGCGGLSSDGDSLCPTCRRPPRASRSPLHILGNIIVVVGFGFISLILLNSLARFPSMRAQGQLSQCERNLKIISTALEKYSYEHKGAYPPSMASLVPTYLTVIPTCPGAGTDSYSGSYQVQSDLQAYTFYCQGANHARVGKANYPLYSSVQGLVAGH